MHRKIIAVIALLMCCHIHATTLPKRIQINDRSEIRDVCKLEFPAVKGLTVEANLAPPSAYNSRINNERYEACPYDVKIRYAGQIMRMDFGNDFDLKSIRNYRPSMRVNSGFFVYDGQGWAGQNDTLQDAVNKIRVTEGDNSIIVTGLLHRRNENSKFEDYCYAITVVHEEGYATAGICSEKKEKLMRWQELFGHESGVRYKP
jgi:hypothetical protein